MGGGINGPLFGNLGLNGGFKAGTDGSVYWYLGVTSCLRPGIGGSMSTSLSDPKSGFSLDGSFYAPNAVGGSVSYDGNLGAEVGLGAPGVCGGITYTF
jgi:hypothetical protein